MSNCSDPAAPLRVLWVTKGLGPGGAETLLVAAAGRHDRAKVSLSCAYVLPYKDHLAERLERLGVATTCVGGDLRWPLRLARLVRDGGFDVVHVQSPLPATVARLAVRSLPAEHRPALVSTEHNTWATFKAPTRLANRWSGRLDGASFAVSDEVRVSMVQGGRNGAVVLRHGIDVDAARAERRHRDRIRAELAVGPDEVLIGTAANFRPQKDYPNLLAAMAELARRGVAARLVAVGQGPQEAETRALVRELGLDGRVTLTGFRPDAVAVLGACDVFVLASAWEGLPVAAMEACALGLPVVATAVGGMAEEFTDDPAAVLVPARDANALADALEAVVGDPARRAAMAVAAAEHAARFDIGHAVTVLEDTYTRLAPKRPAPAAAPAAAPAKPKAKADRSAGLDIRPMTDADRAAVLELCRASLGWGDDPRFAELFAWKHDTNAFGPSYAWVATDAGRVVALRTFMRWRFRRGGELLHAARAVDTATHPDYQGRGLFRTMTLYGLEQMRADGVDFVFNTPNSKSMPGYLSMGWRVVGKPATVTAPASPLSALRLARSRVASTHWSEPSSIGVDAAEWLATGPALHRPEGTIRDLHTDRTDEYVRWRYTGGPVTYRAVSGPDGTALVRVRRRGAVGELVLADTFGTPPMGPVALLRRAGCNHALGLGRPDWRHGLVPAPGQGPTLTWRAVNQQAMPPLGNWALSLGDVELL
jgi:glycosyltransferase involved in cell wall biosynthesis